MRALKLFFSIFASVWATCAAADPVVVVQLERAAFNMPTLPGLAPACQMSASLNKMTSLSTPPLEQPLTCWVGWKAWTTFGDASFTLLYPFVRVSRANFTRDAMTASLFQQLKGKLRERASSNGPLANNDTLLASQDKALNQSGFDVKHGPTQGHFAGVFDESEASISYLVVRQSSITVNGSTRPTAEIEALTNFFQDGELFVLKVTEQDDGGISASDAKALSRAWLTAWQKANR